MSWAQFLRWFKTYGAALLAGAAITGVASIDVDGDMVANRVLSNTYLPEDGSSGGTVTLGGSTGTTILNGFAVQTMTGGLLASGNIQNGIGTSGYFPVVTELKQDWVDAVPATTAETTMAAWQINNGALTNEQTMEVSAWGTTAGNVNAKTVRLRLGGLGGTSVGACVFDVAADTQWRATWTVTRTGVDTQAGFVECLGSGAGIGTTESQSTTAAVDDGGDISVVLTVQNATTATDLRVKNVRAHWLK